MLGEARDITIKYIVRPFFLWIAYLLVLGAAFAADDLEQRVEHRFADSAGVKIHYAYLKGPSANAPLAVFIHGFPDYWYSWRNQMDAVSKTHAVAALDTRGYNLSDKPKGAENYDMKLLIADVLAVIKAAGRERAVVIGHDWGGAIAWYTAMHAPHAVERLVIVNLPHPDGLRREFSTNADQQKNSQYARNFQQEDSHTKISAEGLAKMAPAAVRPAYEAAFRRSDLEAMMNYYRRNYPRPPYSSDGAPPSPRVTCRVLQFHGLKDQALLPGALNGTWQWLDSDWTLVTIPNAGHWSHWDAPELVTNTLVDWLKR